MAELGRVPRHLGPQPPALTTDSPTLFPPTPLDNSATKPPTAQVLLPPCPRESYNRATTTLLTEEYRSLKELKLQALWGEVGSHAALYNRALV